jgi:uroporphyrin-3 C-methyltransferase
MNEAQQDVRVSANAAAGGRIKPAPTGKIMALLALALAVGALSVCYFLWQELTTARQQAILQTGQTQVRINALQSSTDKLNNDIARTLTERLLSVQTEQQTLRSSLESLQTQIHSRNTFSPALSEAAHLLRIANLHLQLDYDIPTAQAALSAADLRLRNVESPDVLHIRDLLAGDIATLSARRPADITEMTLALTNLLNSVDKLSLTPETRMPVTARDETVTNDWRGKLHEFWIKIKGLVVIRYDDKNSKPVISPEQAYTLRQNLRLDLATARLALMGHDTPVFQASLDSAQTWLNIYFDTEQPATKLAKETLSRLAETDLRSSLPELSRALPALEALLKQSTDTPANTPSQTSGSENVQSSDQPGPAAP